MKVSYFPGCTVKTTARSMGEAAEASLLALGVELIEPKRWTCCGVLHSLADDDAMRLVGPVRNLIRIKKGGDRKVVTVCAMCYNSLARANLLMKKDSEKKNTINGYFEDDDDYNGEVDVLHLLTFLRDEIGWDAIRRRVNSPLSGLLLAPYYGCTLLRPKELAIEAPARPKILGDLLKSLGATVVDFPASSQCCSSYQSVSHPEIAAQVAAEITGSARKSGAAAIVTCCPLCDYNLGKEQFNLTTQGSGDISIPTFYFTELMAVAFGLDLGRALSRGQEELLLTAKGMSSLPGVRGDAEFPEPSH